MIHQLWEEGYKENVSLLQVCPDTVDSVDVQGFNGYSLLAVDVPCSATGYTKGL